MKLRVLDLFSGIGGFSLGLERAGGFETVAFCEIEPYCRRVLAKHWPNVPCYDDVRTLTAERLAADGIAVDVICGGFPCQDISFAGKRAGLEGARSGLWSEYARLIGELRPRFVVVENVPGLLSLGMGDVLGSLASLGYDATWDCIPAASVGAPHRRDRVWIVANAQHYGRHEPAFNGSVGASQAQRWLRQSERLGDAQDVANASGSGLPNYQGRGASTKRNRDRAADSGGWPSRERNDWSTEPDVGRVAHGVPSRVDSLRALGNAVVPQIPEMIGRAIMEATKCQSA